MYYSDAHSLLPLFSTTANNCTNLMSKESIKQNHKKKWLQIFNKPIPNSAHL